nr:hypothetical protein JVH1_1242 [Rhodococcus sp. JVH1]
MRRSHRWAVAVPPRSRGVARSADRARALEPLVRKTPLWGAVQQDRTPADAAT